MNTAMHARGLALGLAALTGCATSPAPRVMPSDLGVEVLSARTSFEQEPAEDSRRRSRRSAPDDRVDTPKKKKRRRALFFLGVGAAGFGGLGVLSFGIGGRIVQAQIANGFDDGSLTRDERNRLDTTGEVMNGLAIGSAVVGLAGLILAAAAYGVDHSRCGTLPPRRKHCGGHDGSEDTAGPEQPAYESNSPSTETSPVEPSESAGPAPAPAEVTSSATP